MLEKPRVLLIGPHPKHSFGGMATVIEEILSNDIISTNFSVDLWSSFVDGALIKRAIYSFIKERCFKMRNWQYDIYHIHVACDRSTWRKLRYIEDLGEQANRVVIHVHGSHYDTFFNNCNKKQKDRIREIFHKVGAVIVLSEEWRCYFLENEICSSEKLMVINNAVPIPEVGKEDYSSKRVLFMGRLGERKKPDTLLRAAKIVLRNVPDAVFTFAGDGDIDRYKTLASELGISNCCEFRGWVSGEERNQLFRENDIYCLPSRSEGMPMGVLEAMSYGLVTISTPVGGVPQVIRDGSNGFLVPVDDAETLASILTRIMNDSELMLAIGSAGRHTIVERFGIDDFAQKISSTYEGVL